jgi:hypothetical protein
VESLSLHVGRLRHVIKLHSIVFHASASRQIDSLHQLMNGDVRLLKFDRVEGMDLCNRCYLGDIGWCCDDI